MKKRLFISFIVITALLVILSPVVEVAETEREISLSKSADPLFFSEVGQEIEYKITVTNIGNVVLKDVIVVDSKINLGEEADIGTLEPGEKTTVSGSYTITEADLDNGSVTNTAEVTGKEANFIGKGGNVSAQDSVTIEADIDYQPAIRLRKEAAPSTYSEIGDIIDYTITVTNTGNAILNNVTVVDDLLGLGSEADIGTLDPGAETTVNGSYTIVQADLDNGSVTNTADVSGKDLEGTVVEDSDVAEVAAEINPDISINKEAAPTTYSEVGDEITYTITVNNTGNVTLYDVVVTDPLLGLYTNIGTLDPGEEDMITETYTITQEDLSKTAVENTATVSGEDASGTKVEDFNSAQVNADISSEPSISITKEPNPETYSHEGQEIEYTITVTNIGDVALKDVTVVDELLDLDTNIGTLNPGDYEVITESYFITSEDMENGYVYNLAAVTGKEANFIGKGSAQVSDEAEAEITLDFISEPDITITKMADPTTYDSVGDVIDYTITVTNTGNVTLDPVTVTDFMLDLDSNIGSLDPGQVYTLPIKSYTITQSDLDNGSVTNTVLVEGKDPDEELVTDSDDEVVTTEYVPGGTETAWAYNKDYAVTFNELNISNNWGWSNGPLVPEGEYVFELWAGAGQNDFDKGTLVGEVTVSFNDEIVQYNVDNGYYLEEVHLYMGNEQPLTAASGLLGYTNDNVNSQQYTIEFSDFTDVDFNEYIYVAAHAVVVGSW